MPGEHGWRVHFSLASLKSRIVGLTLILEKSLMWVWKCFITFCLEGSMLSLKENSRENGKEGSDVYYPKILGCH